MGNQSVPQQWPVPEQPLDRTLPGAVRQGAPGYRALLQAGAELLAEPARGDHLTLVRPHQPARAHTLRRDRDQLRAAPLAEL